MIYYLHYMNKYIFMGKYKKIKKKVIKKQNAKALSKTKK